MFGMSMTEILFIAVVALVVLGPEKLPKVAQMIGRGLRELRRATSDVREAMEIEDIRRDIRAQIEGDGRAKPDDDPLDDDPYAAARREDEALRDEDFEPLDGDDAHDADRAGEDHLRASEQLPEGTPRWDDSAEDAVLDAEEAAAYHRSSQSVDEDEDDAPPSDASADDGDTLGALAPAGAIAAGGLGALAFGSLHGGAQRPVSAHVTAVALEPWHGIAGLGVLIEREPLPSPPLTLLGGVLAVPVHGGLAAPGSNPTTA